MTNAPKSSSQPAVKLRHSGLTRVGRRLQCVQRIRKLVNKITHYQSNHFNDAILTEDTTIFHFIYFVT